MPPFTHWLSIIPSRSANIVLIHQLRRVSPVTDDSRTTYCPAINPRLPCLYALELSTKSGDMLADRRNRAYIVCILQIRCWKLTPFVASWGSQIFHSRPPASNRGNLILRTGPCRLSIASMAVSASSASLVGHLVALPQIARIARWIREKRII